MARRVVLLALVASSAACAVRSAPAWALIERLRDPDISVRDRAESELRELGVRAEDALRAHRDDGDDEVAARCRRLLDRLIDDEAWYGTAAIDGIDLQALEYERWLHQGNEFERRWATMWFRTLASLSATRASVLREARGPTGAGTWSLPPGLSTCFHDFLFERWGVPDQARLIQLLCDEATTRPQVPILVLARLVARREGQDIELIFDHDSSRFPPVLRLASRSACFTAYWKPWHHAWFRP